MDFKLHADFKPTGDQPQAIRGLINGVKKGARDQTLLGVTGSGKTFTMANVIAELQRPTLIISHNKTLAAQLASEFREFFPKSAVHYFVSYYDYYQPEAYVARSDTFIEKETDINEEIERLRHAATQALLTRKDVIIVASVSCIYGLGSPAKYGAQRLTLHAGQRVSLRDVLKDLTQIQFTRNDIDFTRGSFRVKGDVLDIFPTFADEEVIRVEFYGDEIDTISTINAITGKTVRKEKDVQVFPASLYIAEQNDIPDMVKTIRKEMAARVAWFKKAGKLIEAQRIEERVNFDTEMLLATGFTSGIENYSRYMDGRKPGEASYTLINYFQEAAKAATGNPKDFLLFIDESHMTVPQIGAMHEGDKSRKVTLVDYGFRLPSALDNRPLTFKEFRERTGQTIYVSATPGPYEKKVSTKTVQQLIRPTGLLDPSIEVKPTEHQVDDLVEQIQARLKKKQRVLVTTLTKKMSEDLSEYIANLGIKVTYLHSDIDTLDRIDILRDLRLGKVDVLIGINLLREGLDLPEVSLVAILDADKEGFLRSETSLVQTIGRVARHREGHAILYADRITGSMKRAIDETERRRASQQAYNDQHGITPASIKKAVRDDRFAGKKHEEADVLLPKIKDIPPEELPHITHQLEEKMELAAQNLDFEEAARLRDLIAKLSPKKTIRSKRGKR
ncbi:MAG: excinuclease ABC subunit UvrB [Patescibacteria group bacterium]